MQRYPLALDIDDQLLSDLLSEEIAEHRSGIFLGQQRNRDGVATSRGVANFGVLLQPR